MKKFTLPVAVHLFLFHQDKILLLKRYQTGFMDGKYSVVAGHVEENETVTVAMQREAKEEAGIIIPISELEIVQVMHRKSDSSRIDYFFTASNWYGQPINKEPHKCSELDWFLSTDLPQNIVPYVSYALECYKKKKNFTTFGWD